MKRILKLTGLAILVLLGILMLLLLFAWVRSYLASQDHASLLGPEAPIIQVDGVTYRDLNKNGKLDVYEDSRAATDSRVNDLLAQMTLEEKVGCMFITMACMESDGSLQETKKIWNPISFGLESNSELVVKKHMNHVNTLQSLTPEAMILWHNNIQKLAERTRLGIPVTLATDPRHGVPNAPGASIYSPFYSKWCSPLGLAATRDTQLVREFGDIARQEYKALGFRLTLSPMADLATEPRWGRINGTFGEDAALSAQMTKAYIQGFQGDSIGTHSVSCMVKHFAGGGPQEGGLDAHFPPGRQVYKGNNFAYHLIPFEQGAFPAGVSQIMPYYGIPVGQTSEDVGFGYNKDIITGLLRNRYQFDGIICTDWGLVSDVAIPGMMIKPASAHGVETLSTEERVAKIIDAGCDMFGGEAMPEVVVALVKSGKIREERIDSSVRRILREKFRLGLFDNPYLNPENSKLINTEVFRKKGIEAQQKSLVLLKNDQILPLKAGTRVYLHGFDAEETKDVAGQVKNPHDADVILLKAESPENETKGRYFLERIFNHGDLTYDAKREKELLELIQKKPTVTVVNLQRPAVIPAISQYSKALIADFSSEDRVIMDLIFGAFAPSGKLPFDLPSTMDAVRRQQEDLPFDTENPLYRFGDGLGYQ
jgi:beta-glucosidase